MTEEERASDQDVVVAASVAAATMVPGGVPMVEGAVVEEVAAVSRVEETVPVKSAQTIMLEVASSVADALLVTPSLMRGEGTVIVNLKPDVLDGATVKIDVMGNAMNVQFELPESDTARLIERMSAGLEAHLVEKMPAFVYHVTVARSGASVQSRRMRADERA